MVRVVCVVVRIVDGGWWVVDGCRLVGGGWMPTGGWCGVVCGQQLIGGMGVLRHKRDKTNSGLEVENLICFLISF